MESKVRGIRVRGGRWAYRFMVAGRTFSVTTRLKATERNLPRAAKEMEEHRERICRGQTEVNRRVTLEAASVEFLAWSEMEHRDHPNTARRQRTSLASLQHFFAGRSLDAIRAGQLESYKTWRRENNIKEVTIRHDLHAASQLFQFGQKYGWCESNPVRLIGVPSDRDSRSEKILTADEEREYFNATARNGNLHDVTRLMLLQGLRPDEALSILKANVVLDGNARMLTIPQGKSKAAKRTLALTDEAALILARRMSSKGPWIFPGRGDKPYAYSGLVNAHNRALQSSGTQFNIYSLRHTFASRLYDRSKDIVAVARILGHADLKTVMRYVHTDQAQMDEAMRKYAATLISDQKSLIQ